MRSDSSYLPYRLGLFRAVTPSIPGRLGAISCLFALTILLASEASPGSPTDHAATNVADPATRALLAEIARLEPASGGTLGVAASLVGGDQTIAFHAEQAFPMASTFKIAVAAAILSQVDAGTLTLDQLVTIDPDAYVDSDGIAEQLIHPGVALSIHNLLELMLTRSDNTATDVLTALAGGPAAVTSWLGAHGIVGQRIDRDTSGLIRDFLHLGPGVFKAALAVATQANPRLEDQSDQPNAEFDADARDTSTPAAMLQLLLRLHRGELLSPKTTHVLIDIMERCHTGSARILGLLPEGTRVSHKTGTIGGTVNDVGVIVLPDGRLVALAIFVKKSSAPIAARERVIAEVARTVRDYFLVAGGAPR